MNTKSFLPLIAAIGLSLALPLSAAEKTLTTTIESLEKVEKDMREKAKKLPKSKKITNIEKKAKTAKNKLKSSKNSDLGIPIGLGAALIHGYMFETGYSFKPNLNLKAYVQSFNFESDPQSISFADSSVADDSFGATNEVDFVFQWKMQSYGANLEWFPFDGAFKLIAGINHSEDHIQTIANIDTTITVGTEQYDFNAGQLKVTIKQKNPLSGVVGFGFGNFAKGGNFYFSSDFLLKFVEAEATVETPGITTALAEKDRQKILDDLEKDGVIGLAETAFQYSLNFVLGYRL